jgi:hypothetical protein
MSRRARQRASARPWEDQHTRDMDAAERLETLLSNLSAPTPPAAHQPPPRQEHHNGSTPCSRQTHAHT